MSLAEFRTSSDVDVSLVDPLAARLLGLLEHFGGRVLIVSGRRSYAEQVVLWNRYLAGGNLAARPGTSNHGRGRAADLRIVAPLGPEPVGNEDARWRPVHTEAAKRGLRFPIYTPQREHWHVEADPAWIEPPKEEDMTKEEFAAAIGARVNAQGVIVVPLINDDLATFADFPLAAALTYTHQEMKTKRIRG